MNRRNLFAAKITSLLTAGLVVASSVVYLNPNMYLESARAEDLEQQESFNYTYADFKSGRNIADSAAVNLDDYEKIEIANEQDWETFAEACTNDAWSRDKYVVLTADIILSQYQNACVPTFGGIFDGDGHSISDVCIIGMGSAYGLFRYVQESGRISNLIVVGNVSAEYSAGQIAILAGENYGTISNCVVSGSADGKNEIGGIVGYNAVTGLIVNCISRTNVSGNHSVGGVVGSNDGTISECDNEGDINTIESEVTVDITEITVDSITEVNSSTNMAAFTDVGGIAGISEGTIVKCSNSGHIGYEHVGYNIGGIVGRISQGCVEECVNRGHVYGRKDVGGIAGQMEPFLQMEYMTDGVGRMNEEVDKLLDLMDKASVDLEYYGNRTSNVLGEMSDALLDANQITAELPDGEGNTSIDEMKSQIEAVQNNLISLADDMAIIADYSDKLSEIIDDGTHVLTADLRAIINQTAVISSLAASIRADVFSYGGIDIRDNSVDEAYDFQNEANATEEENTEETDTIEEPFAGAGMSENGRLISCTNYGMVEADTAVGGIVGRIATEYDANPEDDLSLTGDQSLYINATARAVVRGCINYARITSKKDYCGGIAGYAKIGALISDVSSGDIISENGNYIGGVAGECNSDIISCYTCGQIAGKSYVGGIVGNGMNISDSISVGMVEASGERRGAIAGTLSGDGVLAGNCYVNSEMAAIDGIDYEGGAVAVDYDTVRNMSGIPEEFKEIQFIFIADGQELGRVSTVYGDTISEEDIPKVPEKEGYFGIWPDYNCGYVCGSTVVEAIYEKWLGSVQSKETITVGDTNKPLVLAVGDFLPGAELNMTVNDNEYDLGIYYSDDSQLAINMGVDGYSGCVNVRFAVAREDSDNIAVEVYKDGNWTTTDTVQIGSYVSFDMEIPGKFRIIENADYTKYIIIGIVVALIVILALTVIFVSKGRKIHKKMILKKTPKAVIFDLDGTIIDTEKYYRRVWPKALEHFGYKPTDEQALELRSLGRPFAPRKLKEWFGEDFDYDAVRNYRKELFERCIEEEGIALKPGVKELLDELRERNITIAIATATDVERTKKYLDKVGIADYFDKICSAANVKEGKPSPDVYAEACRQLKLEPEECFAVEDAPNGIRSAAAAGCRVIFVPDQTQDEPEVENLVFAKVQSADEIIALL